MSFINEKTIKAVRKRHVCQACNKWIEVGETAISWAGMTDSYFSSAHYHPECREAEVRLNYDVLGWGGCDDWVCLGEADAESRPWIKKNHPIAYLRMCMTREQWASYRSRQLSGDEA